MNTSRNGARAFTLIELLLVMVILVVLASVVVPMFTRRRADAEHAKAVTDIHNLSTAICAFEIDCGRFPTTEEGLSALVDNSAGLQGWHGPYIQLLSKDPWGTPYVYQCPGIHALSGFDLSSWGPDKHEGGNDDITNWQN